MDIRHTSKLINDGALKTLDEKLPIFTRDVEFPSPSTAAGVVTCGTAPGSIAWKAIIGMTLKEIDLGKE